MLSFEQAFGLFSGALILLAYGLVSMKIVKSDSYLFHALNLVGAFGLVLTTDPKTGLGAFSLNVCWIMISVYSIFRRSRNRSAA